MMHFPFTTMQGLIMKQKFLALPETTGYNKMHQPYGRANSVLNATNSTCPCWLWGGDFKLCWSGASQCAVQRGCWTKFETHCEKTNFFKASN